MLAADTAHVPTVSVDGLPDCGIWPFQINSGTRWTDLRFSTASSASTDGDAALPVPAG